MSALRSVLIVFAVLLLAAIYWWGRRGDRQRRAENLAQRLEPEGFAPLPPTVALDEFAALSGVRREPTVGEPQRSEVSSELQAEPHSVAELQGVEPEPAPAAGTPLIKIIALRLVAATPRFSGAYLRTALEAEGLAFGKYQIFHRTTPEGSILFSVASMLEPGSFDLEQMFHQQFPGIALFAQLPSALDGASLLNELIGCGRRLQQTLGGVLQDDQGTPLLAFRIEQLRREIRDFEEAARQARPHEPTQP